MESGLDGRNNKLVDELTEAKKIKVSMESGLDGRNNLLGGIHPGEARERLSQWSPA